MISNKNRLTIASPDSEVSLYAPMVDEAENIGDNNGDMFLDDGGFDEDNLFLESESEADEFFDVLDTEEEAGESDYGVDSIPVIPEIKTVGEEESTVEDNSEIAEDVENVFILLLSNPETRDDIIKLVSGRTASGRNGSDFVKRYMKACGHNSAVQLYPKMVKALSAKEFYADGDGSLYLGVDMDDRYLHKVKQSLSLLKSSNIDLEVRTTLFRGIDCDSIREWLEKEGFGKTRYFTQSPLKGTDIDL